MVVSMGLNYYLYHQNKGFKMSIGSDYLVTVRQTLFELNTPIDFWIEELNKDNSDVLLERYKGELETLADDFSDINGKIGMIGDQLRTLSDLYSELENTMRETDDKENISEIREEIVKYQHFIVEILKDMENKLEEDKLLWYQELSNPDSETTNKVWDEFKTFEKLQSGS